MQAYRKRYDDFGPAFGAEKPAETEGITVSASTMRRWMLAEGLWSRKRQSSEYRGRRDRRESFGGLIQFDGRRHRCFEERGLKRCLITLIDDTANTRLYRFFDGKTAAGAMDVLKLRIGKYGIPQALYRGKKNAFALTREPADAELLKGITKPTSRFGKARGKLGIDVIAADSPRAKGRAGRNHGLDHDRLAKELRLAGISAITGANKFLIETYPPKINSKFSRPAKSPLDAYLPLLNIDLRDIFCFEYERRLLMTALSGLNVVGFNFYQQASV